jgi:hypothetical protein
MRMIVRFIRKLMGCEIGPDAVRWVVNDIAELGVEINGRVFFLYKGGSLEYNGLHDDGSPMLVRMVGKREFGETCNPNDWDGKYPYTINLTYHPILSDSMPDEAYWHELPIRVIEG